MSNSLYLRLSASCRLFNSLLSVFQSLCISISAFPTVKIPLFLYLSVFNIFISINFSALYISISLQSVSLVCLVIVSSTILFLLNVVSTTTSTSLYPADRYLYSYPLTLSLFLLKFSLFSVSVHLQSSLFHEMEVICVYPGLSYQVGDWRL
jgi:hypothetical protein